MKPICRYIIRRSNPLGADGPKSWKCYCPDSRREPIAHNRLREDDAKIHKDNAITTRVNAKLAKGTACVTTDALLGGSQYKNGSPAAKRVEEGSKTVHVTLKPGTPCTVTYDGGMDLENLHTHGARPEVRVRLEDGRVVGLARASLIPVASREASKRPRLAIVG